MYILKILAAHSQSVN